MYPRRPPHSRTNQQDTGCSCSRHRTRSSRRQCRCSPRRWRLQGSRRTSLQGKRRRGGSCPVRWRRSRTHRSCCRRGTRRWCSWSGAPCRCEVGYKCLDSGRLNGTCFADRQTDARRDSGNGVGNDFRERWTRHQTRSKFADAMRGSWCTPRARGARGCTSLQRRYRGGTRGRQPPGQERNRRGTLRGRNLPYTPAGHPPCLIWCVWCPILSGREPESFTPCAKWFE